jgi:CelD/BcsL family acetyltransferase involved in cellulose biosynthesis
MNTLAKETKKEAESKILVTEYQDSSVFDTLAQKWNQLTTLCSTTTPFLTCQWQKIWWNYWNQGCRLRIITVSKENGRLCGIAPLYSDEKKGDQKLMLLGSTDLCDYLDCIVARGEEEHFYHTLLTYLESSATTQTIICLNSLQQHSPTLSFLKEMAECKGYTLNTNLEDKAPSLDLPLNFESYLRGLTKKDRHEIRRKTRKAEKRVKIAFRKIDHPSQVMQKMSFFLNLFRKSADKKNAFLNRQRETFFLTIAQELSRMGWLELFTLSFDEKEVAYLLCFNYHDTLYLYNSAYDPTYSTFSPGIVAITYCLKDAINRGIKRFDFLRGNESYKYHFGAQEHNLYTLTLRLPGEKSLCTE